MSFVHLHVHSHYSVLDGMSKIEDLVDRALQYDMPGIALTDHGSMYGVKEFLDCVKKRGDKAKGFKPIVGFEAYCARRTHKDKDKDFKIYDAKRNRERIVDEGGYHLILLAKNKIGYQNLCKLCSIAWIDGHYYHPRIDKALLEKYHEGIICASACLGGEIPQLILNDKLAEAEESVQWFKQLFGDDYYLELQRHQPTRPEIENETYLRQQQVNKVLVDLAKKYSIKLIATNDLHFVDREHADAHERLVYLSTGKKITDKDGNKLLYTKEEYLKTEAEMREIFADLPEAIDNTIEILDKIETYSLDSTPIMPKFDIPASFGTEEEYRQKYTEQDLFDEFIKTADGKPLDEEKITKKLKDFGGYEKLYRIKLEADYLHFLTYEGAKERFAEITDDISQRIDFELNTIKMMGFPGYFLIVSDFMAEAKKMGVWVGPGRGSAAGSAVAYCLKITNINPFDYDLLFERFLNPDRISMPDIDIDFDDDGRAQVLEWVTQKYGKECVAHIITFGAMATKSSVADVGRVQDVPLNEVNELKKIIGDSIPDYAKDKVTKELPKFNIKNVLKFNKEVKKACDSNPTFKEIMNYASQLEGTVRQVGIHACGVIIGSDDLTNYVPLSIAKEKVKGKPDKEVLVTQYDGHFVENVGLIKMDFLGLKTLSIIKEAISNIKKSNGINLDINEISLTDKETYEVYSQGKTIGIFQFESPGMQKYLRELQPTNIGDLIAMNALYRPGPMEYIPDFISRKHGRTPVVYDIPIMEKYLKDTYGVTVYQEQVMLLSRLLANFTPGQADSLRKAMGKKIKSMLDDLKPKFINGGIANGYQQEILEKIWKDWESFASYAFNKSHSACYSLLSYQTAYLKAHYPAEFMAANLTRNKDSITDVNKFMEECKSMKIPVKGPDVNESEMTFTVNKRGEIRFGLGGIKNVGEAAVENIVQERKENGNFTSIYDFLERVDLKSCNKKTIEAFVLSGGFDCFKELSREDYFSTETTIDDLISYGKRMVKVKTGMKNSLFEDDDTEIGVPKPEIRPAAAWDKLHKLNRERELIGIYLSEHPLDEYRSAIEYGCSHTLSELKEFSANAKTEIQKITNIAPNDPNLSCNFTVGGVIIDSKIAISKNNRQYGILTLEDYTERMEFRFFGRDFENFKPFLQNNLFVVIRGKVEPSIQFDKNTETEIKRINENISSIHNLANEAPNMVKNLNIETRLSAVDKLLIEELVSVFEQNIGKIDLDFTILDKDENRSVILHKKDAGVALSAELLRTLETLSAEKKLDFSVNNKKYRNKSETADEDEVQTEVFTDDYIDD